ncbi:hypothetical protein [Xanthomonas phage JGB6]|nr:hypothetical protein [Xanthomonas phage JGB6]
MSEKINLIDRSWAGVNALEAIVALGDEWEQKVFGDERPTPE